MKISIGSDHGAVDLKNQIVKYLKDNGHEVLDFGTNSKESCDYPDFAYPAALALSKHEVDRAIVLCTTGIGVSIVANKVKGVRCSLVHNKEFAILTREHNDSNCLALGSLTVDFDLAKEIINAWLETKFSNGKRHLNRLEKIRKIEVSENE